MNILREKLRCLPMGAVLRKGSKSNSSTEENFTDARVTAGTVGLSQSDGNTLNVNSTDAVQAIAAMGADTINKTGAAVVQLHESSNAANLAAWDLTVNRGADLVDKLIDASSSMGTAAITSFQPAENKAQDTGLKLGMIAAAAVAATILLNRQRAS